MYLLKEEIEIFNPGLKLVCLPAWITKEETRLEKMHSSVVLAFKTEEEARKALRHKLIVAGTSVKTMVYQDNKPTDQCKKCQQYGHYPNKCHNQTKCQICAGPHDTRQHKCHSCKSMGEACPHTQIKCTNCQGPHKANNPICEIYKALQPISYTSIMDPLSMEWK